MDPEKHLQQLRPSNALHVSNAITHNRLLRCSVSSSWTRPETLNYEILLVVCRSSHSRPNSSPVLHEATPSRSGDQKVSRTRKPKKDLRRSSFFAHHRSCTEYRRGASQGENYQHHLRNNTRGERRPLPSPRPRQCAHTSAATYSDDTPSRYRLVGGVQSTHGARSSSTTVITTILKSRSRL